MEVFLTRPSSCYPDRMYVCISPRACACVCPRTCVYVCICPCASLIIFVVLLSWSGDDILVWSISYHGGRRRATPHQLALALENVLGVGSYIISFEELPTIEPGQVE